MLALAGSTVALGSGGSSRPGILVSADRAPAFADRIYAVDSTGRRTTISRGPYPDISPTLSPDGRKVAFLRTIGAGEYVYVADVAGRHVQRVSSALAVQGPNATGVYLVWSPDSRRVEINTGAGTYVVGSGVKQRRVLAAARAGIPVSWSPDSRLIAVPTGRAIVVVTRTGRVVKSFPGNYAASWSRTAYLAIVTGKHARIYDRSWKRVANLSAELFAWSPDGRWLADVVGRRLEVRTPRGRLVLERRLAALSSYEIAWAGSGTVVVADGSGERLTVAVPGGSERRLPSVDPTYLAPSADGVWLADPVASGGGYALRVERWDGRDARTFLRVRACPGYGGNQPAVAYPLQLTPDGRLLVYQIDCPQPFVNLYLVSPAGSVRRLTSGQTDDSDPQWSPDGRRIAFLEGNGPACHECIWSVWVANADGTHARQLTFPNGRPGAPPGESDGTPSWSPDGKRIAFYRSNYVTAGGLLVVSADGGTPRRLARTPSWVRTRPEQTRSRTGVIAYIEQQGNVSTIVILGHPVRQIRLPFLQVAGLSWSPDGRRFAFTARRSRTMPFDLYMIGTDGHGLRRLTYGLDATGASWR